MPEIYKPQKLDANNEQQDAAELAAAREFRKQGFVAAVGLAIGEETKASTVEWLAHVYNSETTWRSGGCQAGHHIVRADGTEQMFSHFAASTFEGTRTHLQNMVINPVDLFSEAIELEEKGVENPLSNITISGECLVITPFHGALSRLKEIYRGEQKKGTIGMGVGDALKDFAADEDWGITAAEFSADPDQLRQKVEQIRQRKLRQANELVAAAPWWYYLEGAEKEFLLLEDEGIVGTVVESFQILADLVQITDEEHTKELLAQKGVIVGEPSHGALLHPRYGFLPHTTQIDPTAQDVLSDLDRHDYQGQVLRLGVSRCYMTRHGAGPLVSYSPELTREIEETHNDASNLANQWLGEFRNGHYDLLAMQYAIAISGGVGSFSGLMISYLDKLADFDEWQVCEAYEYTGDDTAELGQYFEMEGDKIIDIKVHADTGDDTHVQHQLRLTELLKQCTPVLKTLKPSADLSLEEVFIEYVEQRLGLAVVACARGPKLEDRQARPGWEHVFSA